MTELALAILVVGFVNCAWIVTLYRIVGRKNGK